MDLITTEDNRNWTALLAAVVAAFLVAFSVGFVLDNLEETSGEKGGRGRIAREPRLKPDEPDIRQARWKLVAFPSSAVGDITTQQKKAVARVAPSVKATVQDLYDAMTVSRGQLKEVSARLMTPPARRALAGKPLIPFGLDRIQTTKREARIAIDRRGRALASAEVSLAIKADRGKKRIKFAHSGTLWLEKGPARWRVIGFKLDRRKVG